MSIARWRPPRIVSVWLNYGYELWSVRTARIGWAGIHTYQNAVGRCEIRECCVKNEIQNRNVN